MQKAKLIVIEGGDGAGKGTQLDLITKHFQKNNSQVAFLHFPMYGHNQFSKIIASYLKGEYGNINEVDPYFVANIYAMDRYMYLPTLKKLLNDNDVVIMDRYVFSNKAYQGAKYPVGSRKSHAIQDWIDDLEFEFLQLPYPDLTLFLDNSIDVIKTRLTTIREGSDREYLEGKQDIHEKDMDFQAKVRLNYLSYDDGFTFNYHIIPCQHIVENVSISFSPEELFNSYKHLFDVL